MAETRDDLEETILLAEEALRVDTRRVDRGGVRVTTRTEARTETVRVALEDVAVEVERVPQGRFVAAAEGPREEGDVTILPVYEERQIVETRLWLVEEVHVRRRRTPREEEIPVELRRQVAEVERLARAVQPLRHPPPDTRGVTPMADTITGSRTLTAMFDTSAEAERAVERLRAAGVPDASIRVTAGSSEQSEAAYPEQQKGFFESLGDFFFPDEDRYAYAEGLARGAQIVTVTNYDEAQYDTVVDILDDEGSVDLDARTEEWKSAGWSDYRETDYYDEDEYNRNHRPATTGVGAGLAGMAGAATGAASRAADAVGDALTPDPDRGTVYDDGLRGTGTTRTGEYRTAMDTAGSSVGSATDVGATGYGATTRQGEGAYAAGTDEEGTVKVMEERLNVGKREVEGGRVRVRSYVREEPASADVELRSTRVFVERRPVDRAATSGDLGFEDRTIEAREHVEEAMVSKEARVTEEIGLRQESESHTETVSDTVRKTEVEIEDERTGETSRIGGDDATRTDRERF